jgi:uncharacterized metal-binding protein
MKKTRSASKILVIDGCDLDCVKNCLEKAGFAEFEYIRVTDLGLEKGKSPANEENINKVTSKAIEVLS